ncbi:transposase, partial [Streptomyces sp. NPDC059378]
MSRKLPLSEGETSRTACARTLVHAGVDEKTGEVLTAAVLAERVGWCTGLAAGMTASLLGEHWNTADVNTLAAGVDAQGRKLPSSAWMALRRLGWTTAAPEGVKVNDRIVRAVQEQAGRALRSVKWRADVVAAILATWPVDPKKRTEGEWEAVRAAIPGGEFLLSSVIRSRTRQIAAYLRKNGHLPVDVFALEGAPRVARLLLLAACDGQQASIERSVTEPTKVLLRLQLPTRPGPQKYAHWSWVACTIKLPPTVPPNAVLHLPTLRIVGGKVRADLAYTHPVPKAQHLGHTVALGVDWGLNTLLSAGAA